MPTSLCICAKEYKSMYLTTRVGQLYPFKLRKRRASALRYTLVLISEDDTFPLMKTIFMDRAQFNNYFGAI